MIVHNGGVMAPLSQAVLFPYDDRTIPFRYRLRIGLVEGMNPYKGHLIAMERGAADAPDAWIKYYGSVCEVDGEMRLWYLGHATTDGRRLPARVCYATSSDGLTWTKPDLDSSSSQARSATTWSRSRPSGSPPPAPFSTTPTTRTRRGASR